ncbi:molybdopterin-binding protein [Kouleothrix sp.]|uniref:molybdopterin-binding protein n=1 Tax=Kouleothrix sp. TaxID=2779161 RepID=UPI00391BA09D
MYQATLPPEQAIGHILRHNLADARGHKAFAKGHRLAEADLPRLHGLGVERLRVAVLEPGDVHEDEAARRLAAAVCGPGIAATAPASSRVNLLAEARSVVHIDVERLLQINQIDGLTIATLPSFALARAGKRIATIKIIPFAVEEQALAAAEAIGRAGAPVVALAPLRPARVGVVLVGSAAARERISAGVLPAITARVAELGSAVIATHYVAPEELAVAGAIGQLRDSGAELVIVAGETSIMDRDDVTPQGIRMAGGRVEHYGAPVEPGNLLLLAYIGAGDARIPVLGAPGCVRSRDTNIVDLLLPRLLAGEYIARRDIVALGHGGLLG